MGQFVRFGRAFFVSILLLTLVNCVGGAKFSQEDESAVSDIPQSKIDSPRPPVFKSSTYTAKTTNSGGDEGEASQLCQSAHNYANSSKDITCTFTTPGNSDRGISLHFANFATERNYDFVYLYDAGDTLQAIYHGNLGSFWSEQIPGHKVTLRFRSDQSVNDWGFAVDKFAYGATPTAAPPAETSGWQEIAVNYESTHGKTLLPGKHFKEEILIHQPGAEEVEIRFKKLMIDLACILSECQVKVEVYRLRDNGITHNLVKKYAGSTLKTNHWQNEKVTRVAGDSDVTIKVVFEINTTPFIGGVFNEYGFKIDRLNVKGPVAPQAYVNKYPIVLCHGMGGFDTILNVDYFFRVKKYLKARGYQVFITEVPPFGSLQTRVDSLHGQLENIRSQTGASKLNLVGHSMGGLDIRLIASSNTTGATGSSDSRDSVKGKDYADKIATLTTIATPHHGSRIADMALQLIPGEMLDPLAILVNIFGGLYSGTNISANDAATQLYYVSETFASSFNSDHPAPGGLAEKIFTYAGVTNKAFPILGNSDEVDGVLIPLFTVLRLDPRGGDYALNDGLVSLHSAKWSNSYHTLYQGGNLKADHYNQVGQILGITDPAYNHLDFFDKMAQNIVANE